MSAKLDGDDVRRSNRLRNREPEFLGLEGPERSPLRPDGRPSKEERDLNTKSGRKQKVKPAEHRLHSNHKESYENGGNTHIETVHTVRRQKTRSEIITNKNPSIENQCTQKFVLPTNMLENHRQRTQPAKASSIYKIILLLAFIVLPVLFLINKVPEGETCKDLANLFPQQSDRLWGFVSHGMADTEPFVLLLVHGGEAELANCLAKHIAVKVGRARTKTNLDPIILDGRNDHSNLLLSLKSQMEKHHALVLQNIEYMHGNVADKLHFILDTFEPWVPGGVYVLTLHVPNIDDSLKESFSAIRTLLRRKWSGLIRDDDLDPLITRISNFDYVIKKDTNPCKQNL